MAIIVITHNGKLPKDGGKRLGYQVGDRAFLFGGPPQGVLLSQFGAGKATRAEPERRIGPPFMVLATQYEADGLRLGRVALVRRAVSYVQDEYIRQRLNIVTEHRLAQFGDDHIETAHYIAGVFERLRKEKPYDFAVVCCDSYSLSRDLEQAFMSEGLIEDDADGVPFLRFDKVYPVTISSNPIAGYFNVEERMARQDVPMAQRARTGGIY